MAGRDMRMGAGVEVRIDAQANPRITVKAASDL
jgi:hypothetical protein